MMYRSINPFSGELLFETEYEPLPDLMLSTNAFITWRRLSITERILKLKLLSDVIFRHRGEFARLITQEMGKPIQESFYEIDKVITAFNYYLVEGSAFLSNRMVETGASKSYVQFDPMGILLSIMPWNFPFWQVFRFAIPSLLAGNVTVLKHAPSVPLCAAAIKMAFKEAGFEKGVFESCYLSNEQVQLLIADDRIAAVSFTGSNATGAHIASLAGKYVKKCVLELGGNDAFIIAEDADIDEAVRNAVKSRAINAGQSCNAAKRFIAPSAVYDIFREKIIKAVNKLKVGDPMLVETQIGPLARFDLAEKVRAQIAATIAQGAIPYFHPFEEDKEGNFIRPTILDGVVPGMTAFDEEIFGPVWSLTKATNLADAIRLANLSKYGLGASIWTSSPSTVEPVISELQTGNVFINEIVKSDPRLPFGGVKQSGYGRELSEAGLMEFVNLKTVYLR